MMKAAILALAILSSVALAEQVLGPVTMVHQPSGTPVYVAAFWWQQFPNRDDSECRHLVLAVPVATWNNWGVAKRDVLLNGLTRLLNGEARATRANVATWVAALNAGGIATDVVLPGEMPSLGARLFIIVVPDGQAPKARLAELGVVGVDTGLE